MAHWMLVTLFAAAMLVGVAGSVLPVLPGLPLMFGIAVVFGFVDGFEHLLPWELVVLFVLMLVSLAVDYMAGILGAKYGGASRASMLWGMAGFVAGMLVFPPFGGLIGLFLAVLLSEVYGHRDNRRAFRAASGSVIGSLAGIITGVFIALLFLALFVFFALR